MSHVLDPKVERGLRTFLLVMRREAQRRHPQRVENPVPVFEQLSAIDRTILLNAMGHAMKAAEREDVEARINSRDPISTV